MKSLINQFNALSTTKKVLVSIFFLTVIIMPFQAIKDAEKKNAYLAQLNAMTPEERAAHDQWQQCQLLGKEKCAKFQDSRAEATTRIKRLQQQN